MKENQIVAFPLGKKLTFFYFVDGQLISLLLPFLIE